VTDGEGGSTTVASSGIDVTAVAPTASVTGIPDSSVNELSPLTLGVTSSDINPANTDTYAWSVTKNGGAYSLPSPLNTTGTSFTFTPNDAGTYVVSCDVTNSEGQSTTVTSGDITVAPIPPTVSISLADGTRAEGTAISASAVVGSVGATDTVTYAWSVQRDGVAYVLPESVSTTGSAFTFTPGDEGSYQILLTATDSGGPTDASSSAISVADVAPSVYITGQEFEFVQEGTAINLGASVTQTGANDSVSSYAWTVNDFGEPANLGGVTTNTSTLSFTPLNQGVYQATVVVTNAGDGSIPGGQTEERSFPIFVERVAPTVTVSGTSGPVTNGSTLNFSAAATEPGGHALSYSWNVTLNGNACTLPDGTDTTSSSLGFAAGLAGSYVATCTVTDTEDAVGTGSSDSVTVTDVAPSVTVTGEPGTSIPAGTPVALNAAATDPGALEHFNYSWSVTLNGSNYPLLESVATNAANLDFTPDRVGNYVATVVVTDTDGGATSVSSTSMAVTDVAPTVTVTGPASAVNEGQNITFAGSATNPTIGDTFSYSWSVTLNGNPFTLPGGTNSTGTSLSFIAPTGGAYVATAAVTDSAASVGTGSASATVNYVLPTVSVTGAPAQGISAGSAVNLTANPAEAGSGHTFTYAWTVTRNGVGYTLSESVVTNASTFSFNPGRAGTFVATVVVTDEASGTATASTSGIVVGDVAPAVGISGAPLASIPEGDAISLTASPTSPGSDETFTYQWSVTKGGVAYALPNGVVTNTDAITFTPGVAGSYVASVTVTDLDNGVTTVSTAPMVVSATAATVSVSGAPGTAINSGTAVNLTATASNSGPGEQFTYQWSVTLNGQPYTLPQSTATTNSSFGFITTDGGLYVATCVATDTSGQQESANSGSIIVNAVAPTVSISGTPAAAVNEGTPVALTAVPADANSADTYSYAWSVTKNGNPFTLPQGTATNAASFSFTPNDVGAFVATVTVTDKANLTAQATASITSDDVAPIVSIAGTPQAPIGVGTPLSFTGSVTNIGTSDSVSSYAWAVTKNGNSYTPQGNPATNGTSFTFTPDGEGTYVVTLTATNNHGSVGTSSTSDITIRPVAPNVNISGTTGSIDEGDAVSLTAAATDPSTGDTYTYAWTVTRNGSAYTLPDSVSTTGATLNFTAEQTGTYVATVTVTDMDDEQTIATSSSIVAADVPPEVAISGEPGAPIAENGTPVTLTAAPTEPGSGQTYSYAWSVTKGGVAYALPNSVVTDAATLTFTPGRAGSYVATCDVTDGDGGLGSAQSTAISVTAVDPTVTIAGEPSTSVGEGTAVALTATATDPGVGDTFSYAWTITNGGQSYTPANGTVLTNAALNVTPGQPGSYVATCTVTDADGERESAGCDLRRSQQRRRGNAGQPDGNRQQPAH
jgi:hypothetical protein